MNGYRAYLDILIVKKNEKYPIPTNLNRTLIAIGKNSIEVLAFLQDKECHGQTSM